MPNLSRCPHEGRKEVRVGEASLKLPFPPIATPANSFVSLHLLLAESSTYFIFSLGFLHQCDVYRCESGRCCTFSFFLKFFFIFVQSYVLRKISQINIISLHTFLILSIRDQESLTCEALDSPCAFGRGADC